jgi:hypothetical protein
VKVFTCSSIMLSITILLLIGSVPLKNMILVFWCWDFHTECLYRSVQSM